MDDRCETEDEDEHVTHVNLAPPSQQPAQARTQQSREPGIGAALHNRKVRFGTICRPLTHTHYCCCIVALTPRSEWVRYPLQHLLHRRSARNYTPRLRNPACTESLSCESGIGSFAVRITCQHLVYTTHIASFARESCCLCLSFGFDHYMLAGLYIWRTSFPLPSGRSDSHSSLSAAYTVSVRRMSSAKLHTSVMA